jgi:20S proteasome alpha/beta subunit
MTAIVGVLCRDGLVIGADSSMTLGSGMGDRTIEQPTEKITICAESVIIAGTGQVGLGQRFVHIIETAYSEKLFLGSNHSTTVGTEICRRALSDFGSTAVRPGQYGALVGFALDNKPYLCEFPASDFQPEFKTERFWYCSMGSGQPITDPFLALMREVFWDSGLPTVQDGTFAVTWALDHAVKINPGGINGPVRIAVLEKHAGKLRAKLLQEDDLDEHRQNIGQAKERLRTFPQLQNANAPNTPDIPKPRPQAESAK